MPKKIVSTKVIQSTKKVESTKKIDSTKKIIAPKATIIPPTTKKRTATEAGLTPPPVPKKKAPSAANVITPKKQARKNRSAPRHTVRTNGFFALPAELRNTIYDLLGMLPPTGNIDIQVTSLMQSDSRRIGIFHKNFTQRLPIINLMCTCRAIHGELAAILYGGRIRVQGQAWANWMPGKLTAQYLRNLTLQFSDIGRIPNFNWITLANAKFLDNLTLEISPKKLGISAKDVAMRLKPWAERVWPAREGKGMKRLLDVLQFAATTGSSRQEQLMVKGFGREVKLELKKVLTSMRERGIVG